MWYNRHSGLKQRVSELEQKVDHFMAVTQADLDALTSAINGVGTALASDVTNITAEIAALQSANPNLDLTGLQGAVSSLQATQASVDALDTPPVSPPDAPPAS